MSRQHFFVVFVLKLMLRPKLAVKAHSSFNAVSN